MENQEQNIRSWDDLIFENRNKAYGAYALRQDYSTGLIKGVFTSIGIAVAVLIVAGFSNTQEIIKDLPPLSGPVEFKEKPKILADVVPVKRSEPVRRTNPVFPPVATTEPDPIEPDPEPAQATTGSTEGTTEGTDKTDTGTPTGSDTETEVVAPSQPAFFSHAEVMPAYVGGMERMMKTLRKHMRYPNSAKTMGKEGTVYVEFIVSSLGEIRNVKVVRGFDKDCDKEAVRIVEKLTEWTPGLQNKMAVNVKLVLPIKFQLDQL